MTTTAGASRTHLFPSAELSRVRIVDFTARLLIGAENSGGAAALVEHEIAARSLAAPLHTHANEDEYSYVIAGEVGFEVGDETFVARAGDVVLKPRAVPHAMWNATDEPARMLELIVPGGFEHYFAELSRCMPPATEAPDIAGLMEVAAKYGLVMDLSSIDRLVEAHGLRPAGPPPTTCG